jgi:serine/threonine protein kinase
MHYYTPEQAELFDTPGLLLMDRYRTYRFIRHTNLGSLFAAEDTALSRPVYVEILLSSNPMTPAFWTQAQREAEATRSIPSEHVARVYGVELIPGYGRAFFYEANEGTSLAERLQRDGRMPFEMLHPIAEQILMALAAGHELGIAHKRLSPSKVLLLDQASGGPHVKLLDFGMTPVEHGEEVTLVDTGLGFKFVLFTRKRGHIGDGDVYACAMIIFHALTGAFPWDGRNILTLVDAMSKTKPKKIGDFYEGPIDERLEAFIARGIAQDSKARFPTTADALAAWRELRPA